MSITTDKGGTVKNNRLPIAIGVIAGLLSGPAIALGASAVLSNPDPVPVEPAQAYVVEAVQQPTTTTTATLPPTTVAAPPTTLADDLAAACGPDGMTLVGAEADGSASDLELAALDALREVCADAGMPLPQPQATVMAAPQEIIVYETVEAPAPAVVSPATGQATYHDDDEYEHEDDDDDYYEDDEHSHGEDD